MPCCFSTSTSHIITVLVCIGTLVFSVISILPPTKKFFNEISSSFAKGLHGQVIAKSMVGGAILGTGMTLCGSVSFFLVIFKKKKNKLISHSVPLFNINNNYLNFFLL